MKSPSTAALAAATLATLATMTVPAAADAGTGTVRSDAPPASVADLLDGLPGRPSQERSLLAVQRALSLQPGFEPIGGSAGATEAQAEGSVYGGAVADLDGDGDDETVVFVWEDGAGRYEVRDATSGDIAWTLDAGELYSAFAVPDVDGDGGRDLFGYDLTDVTVEKHSDCDDSGCEETRDVTGTWRLKMVRGSDGSPLWSTTFPYERHERYVDRETATATGTSSEWRDERDSVNAAWQLGLPWGSVVDFDRDGRGDLLIDLVDEHWAQVRESSSAFGVVRSDTVTDELSHTSRSQIRSIDDTVLWEVGGTDADAATVLDPIGDADGDGWGDVLVTVRTGGVYGQRCLDAAGAGDCRTTQNESSAVSVGVMSGPDGERLWDTEIEGFSARSLGLDVNGDGGQEVVSWTGAGFVILDGATGEELWSADLGYPASEPLGVAPDGTPVLLVSYSEGSTDGDGNWTWTEHAFRMDGSDGDVLAADSVTFEEREDSFAYGWAAPVGDHDGDGVRDVELGWSRWSADGGRDGAVMLLGALGGQLAAWDEPVDLTGVADLDGDGLDDLAVGHLDGSFSVLGGGRVELWTLPPQAGSWTYARPARDGSGGLGLVLDIDRYTEEETLRELRGVDGVTGAVRWRIGPYRSAPLL